MLKLLTVSDVFPMLKISEITLRRLIKKGSIPYRRIGRKYFFTELDILKYLDNIYFPIKEAKNDNP